MYTDLFLALLNRNNLRGHPILSALAYAFCPSAARWWLAGADPRLPFDPVWRAIEDQVSGGTLREHLTRYGFERLIADIKKYIEEIRIYRSYHPIQAPELLPLFSGGKLPSDRFFGSHHAINNFGGNWDNLFIYVRTWAYLLQDWRIGMKIEDDSGYILTREKVLLTLPFTRQPVEFNTLAWKVPVGQVMETRIGLLVSRMEQDQLRFSLLRKCSPSSNHPWQNTPAIFALDRESGEAKHFDQTLSDKDLEPVIRSLAKLAKDGPHSPVNALSRTTICSKCGYENLCFHKKIISRHILEIL